MTRRRLIACAVILAALAVFWLIANPRGWCGVVEGDPVCIVGLELRR